MKSGGLSLLSVLCICGCGGGGGAGNSGSTGSGGGGGTTTQPSQPAGPKAFVDGTAASNISIVAGYTLPPGQVSAAIEPVSYGGVAAGDCDGDSDIDLFLTYGDRGPNRLYLNRLSAGGPLQFEDAAVRAGVADSRTDGRGNDRHSGPIFADMDGDGDLDLLLGGLFGDPVKVYANRGDCVFDDVTSGSGLDALLAPQTISGSFGDYDLDGRLDLFLTHWGSPFGGVNGETEHLFRNVSGAGSIRFENVSAVSRIGAQIAAISDDFTDYSFTATFARINDDPWPDIALAADYGTAQLFLSDPFARGSFIDATNAAVRSVEYGMGSAIGDYDFDLDLDWFVTSISGVGPTGLGATGNRLLQNPGGNLVASGLVDVTVGAGVREGMWGWGACFLDIDNDTDLDIYHTNGWPVTYPSFDYERDSSLAFIATGTGTFVNRAEALGLNDLRDARGVVCADLDQDGDMDILQTSNDETNSAALWANTSAAAGRNFLRVRLVGLPPNTQAAGARIFATIGTRTQMREIMIGNNYTSQNPTEQVFGLDASASVDNLRVEWPPLMPGPMQPAPTVRVSVPGSIAGTTLVLCHPELQPVPSGCG
jgi:hypothetical protein